MALALLLRNTPKINGVGLFKIAHVAPLKSFTTGTLAARCLTLVKPTPVVIKTVTPFIRRSISLSAPRYSYINHSTIWSAERVVSGALLATIPLAFMNQSQTLDALMAVSIVLHTHWGMEALITDYMRGTVGKMAHIGLLLISIATLAGMFYLIYNDVGVAATIKKFWAVPGYVEEDIEVRK